MSAKFLDFQQIKDLFSFDDAINFLDLRMSSAGNQLRGTCPTCQSGGPRGLVITPGRGFYCFGAKKGGDQIALVAHVKDIGMRQAAELVQDQYRTSTSTSSLPKRREPERKSPAANGPRAVPALEYLEAENEFVQALGVSPETAEAFGAGFAAKGVLRGRFAVPIHHLDGTIIAYVGIAVKEDQQPRLLFNNFDPTKHLFNLDRVQGNDVVYVARDPLHVLQAYESGVENVVSFLSPITDRTSRYVLNLAPLRRSFLLRC
jgi:CHC2 zinc finger